MLIVEKMEEISTTISYQEDKRSANLTIKGSGNYYFVLKCEVTQYKVIDGIQSNIGILFFRFPASPGSWKQWLQGISRYDRKGRVDKFDNNNALVSGFHFNQSNINIHWKKGKNITVSSFHEIKGRPNARKRTAPLIRRTLETSEEGFQEILCS